MVGVQKALSVAQKIEPLLNIFLWDHTSTTYKSKILFHIYVMI